MPNGVAFHGARMRRMPSAAVFVPLPHSHALAQIVDDAAGGIDHDYGPIDQIDGPRDRDHDDAAASGLVADFPNLPHVFGDDAGIGDGLTGALASVAVDGGTRRTILTRLAATRGLAPNPPIPPPQSGG